MNTCKKAMVIAMQAGVPVLAWGAPGTGKTSFVNSFAKKMGYDLETIIASIREPTDFGGFPIVKEDGLHLEPMAWAKRLSKSSKPMLFIDEISTAPPAVQAALLRVIFDRVVGEHPLPQNTVIVAAANPPEQINNGWNLTPPLANRFVHIDWDLHTDEWVDGILMGFDRDSFPVVNIEKAREALIQSKSVVTAFLKSRPNYLHMVPENEVQAGKAWPSPRTYTMAIRLLAAAAGAEADNETTLMLLQGAIGPGAALELWNFIKEADLPDPQYVLENVDKFKIPDRGDLALAVLTSVATYFAQHTTPQNWKKVMELFGKAAEASKKDIAIPALSIVLQARPQDQKKYPLNVPGYEPYVKMVYKAKIM